MEMVLVLLFDDFWYEQDVGSALGSLSRTRYHCLSRLKDANEIPALHGLSTVFITIDHGILLEHLWGLGIGSTM